MIQYHGFGKRFGAVIAATGIDLRVAPGETVGLIGPNGSGKTTTLKALVGLVRSVFNGDPWWSYVGLWSLLICWVMLGVTLLVVWQGLSRPRPPAATPPSSNPWG